MQLHRIRRLDIVDFIAAQHIVVAECLQGLRQIHLLLHFLDELCKITCVLAHLNIYNTLSAWTFGPTPHLLHTDRLTNLSNGFTLLDFCASIFVNFKFNKCLKVC